MIHSSTKVSGILKESGEKPLGLELVPEEIEIAFLFKSKIHAL